MEDNNEVKNEVKKLEKKMNQFVVIGLGRFGKSVATTLASRGKEVLVIDTNREAINQIEGQVSGAVVADATGNDVLHSLGVQNFDCAINCIGGNLQASILVTYICKELGVSYVVARSTNPGNVNHCVQSAHFMEMDLTHFHTMGGRFRLSNKSVNTFGIFTNRLRQDEAVDHGLNISQRMVFMVVMMVAAFVVMLMMVFTFLVTVDNNAHMYSGDSLSLDGFRFQ